MPRSTALTAITLILLASVAHVSGAEWRAVYWPAAAIEGQSPSTFVQEHVVTPILQWQVHETIQESWILPGHMDAGTWEAHVSYLPAHAGTYQLRVSTLCQPTAKGIAQEGLHEMFHTAESEPTSITTDTVAPAQRGIVDRWRVELPVHPRCVEWQTSLERFKLTDEFGIAMTWRLTLDEGPASVQVLGVMVRVPTHAETQ